MDNREGKKWANWNIMNDWIKNKKDYAEKHMNKNSTTNLNITLPSWIDKTKIINATTKNVEWDDFDKIYKSVTANSIKELEESEFKTQMIKKMDDDNANYGNFSTNEIIAIVDKIIKQVKASGSWKKFKT